MSFGSKPQTVDNDPYKNMPAWVKTYYQNQIARSQSSDNRADALRLMFSGFTPDERTAVEGYRSPEANRTAPAESSTNSLLSRLAAASGSGGGGMWSDGMTPAQISAERGAGTFGSGMPSSQRGQSFGDSFGGSSSSQGGFGGSTSDHVGSGGLY